MITVTCATTTALERAKAHMNLASGHDAAIYDRQWEVVRGEVNSITGCDGDMYAGLWRGIFGEESH